MNVLMITENDPAGMAIAFSNALNLHTDCNSRLITTQTRYNFDFEKDIHLPDIESHDEITELLEKADIIHFHILADENLDLGPVKIKDYLDGKKILHHHHGHPDFRSNPEKYGEKYKKLGRKVIVSTPDLQKMLPQSSWQPNIVPINDSKYLPGSIGNDSKIKIGHSPTRKDLKNTSEFIEVTDQLIEKHPEAERVIIENTKHEVCLKLKQQCNIIFDHMQGYFGVSSLEALSQGKAVVAGLDDWNINMIQEYTKTEELPWVLARNENDLKGALEKLIQDNEFRKSVSEKSRTFMETSWSDRIVAEKLNDFYKEL